MKPIEDFENGISMERILLKLNTGNNIFDFEYLAQERDTLFISFNAKNRTEYQYFSLIFLNGIWQKGANPAFTSIHNAIAEGEIKVIYKDGNIFLKHCEDLYTQYGIEVPEAIKIRGSQPKNDSEDPMYLAIKNFKGCKVFYKPDFIKYIAQTYFKIYPNNENYDSLQKMVDIAQNSFSLLENKFISQETNLAFINRCFKDFNQNTYDCLHIAIPIQDNEYVITGGILHGRIATNDKKREKYLKNTIQKLQYERLKFL
ncbi:hypothetical protein [Chryseobacterium sp. JK1]|uniref:hypothetical protein n=1 Tax=Chryseobacterium sp. JK1 TaxID=874294 RepID=UPI003D68DDE2